MTVSWGFVHRNRKIGPLFGRSFGKCFAVISGLYRTPGRARTGPGWDLAGPWKLKKRLKIDFEPLFPISGKWQENRHLGDFWRVWPDLGGFWDQPGWTRADPGQGPARTSPSWSGSSPRSVRELAQVDSRVVRSSDLSRIWSRSEQDLSHLSRIWSDPVAYVGHMLTCPDMCVIRSYACICVLYDMPCASQIIFGIISQLEMLFRFSEFG